MFGRETAGADAGLETRALLDNMSLAVGRGCCGCLLSDGRRLNPASKSRSSGGVDRVLD